MARVNRSAIVALIACAGAITPAHAAPTKKIVAVSGSVASSCTTGSVGTVTLTSTIGSTGTIDPTLQDRTWVIPGWYCNSASSIRLSATSLRRSPALTALKKDESQAINFTARATGWSATEARAITNDTNALGTVTAYPGPAQSQNAAKAGTITLKVDDFIIVGTAGKTIPKLIAGNYSARIVITLSPSQ